MEGGVAIRVENRPYVPAYINGAGPFWLVLDTGSAGSFVGRGVAGSLGLRRTRTGSRPWRRCA